MNKVVNYISESFVELRSNVTWLEWAEVQRLTIIVAVFSIIFAVSVWGVDEFFSRALAYFFEKLESTNI